MKRRCVLLIISGVVLGVITMGLIPDKVRSVTTDELVEMAEKNCTSIDSDGIAELMMGDEVYTLLDVRQEIEHYYGYIPGSVILPRGSIEFNIGNEEFWENEGIYMPLKDEIIVVYCKKGSRGALAAQTLNDMGYKKVFYLEGGFKKWESDYPDYVEKNLNALGGGHEEEDTGGC